MMGVISGIFYPRYLSLCKVAIHFTTFSKELFLKGPDLPLLYVFSSFENLRGDKGTCRLH